MNTKDIALNSISMSEATILFDEETAKSVCDFTNTLWSHNMTAGIHWFLQNGDKESACSIINIYVERMMNECGIDAMDVFAVLGLLV